MDMVNRLLTLYNAATPYDVEAGREWYANASATAHALLAGTPLSLAHAAGVIAALSPRVRWSQNVRAAALMVDHATMHSAEPRVDGFGRNRAKAWRIANGENPYEVLGGKKVLAFFANILGDLQRVTVDSWAARAVMGDEPFDSRIPDALYDAIADAYIIAADRVGLEPAVFQAIIWVQIRRQNGLVDE